MKKKIKIFVIIILSLCLISLVLFIGLKKNIDIKDFNIHKTNNFEIYYENLEPQIIIDIGNRLENESVESRLFFETENSSKTKIIIYDKLNKFQYAYGLFFSWTAEDWATGAAYKESVLIYFPEKKEIKNYQNTLEILSHEYVHTLIYRLNEIPDIWIDEGMATFFANQKQNITSELPTFEQMKSQDINNFVDLEGYTFAYYYAEYLINNYPKDQIINLIKTDNYEKSLGKIKEEIYSQWKEYMKR